MKANMFDATDPVSIHLFLNQIMEACDYKGIREGAEKWI